MSVNGKIAVVQKLEVSRDLSGGVKIVLGGHACILSPQQAVEYAKGVLKAAGVGVEVVSRGPTVLHAPRLRIGG